MGRGPERPASLPAPSAAPHRALPPAAGCSAGRPRGGAIVPRCCGGGGGAHPPPPARPVRPPPPPPRRGAGDGEAKRTKLARPRPRARLPVPPPPSCRPPPPPAPFACCGRPPARLVAPGGSCGGGPTAGRRAAGRGWRGTRPRGAAEPPAPTASRLHPQRLRAPRPAPSEGGEAGGKAERYKVLPFRSHRDARNTRGICLYKKKK